MKKQDRQPSEPPPRTRRPYEAPTIVESADFETLALACNKLAGQCVGLGGPEVNS